MSALLSLGGRGVIMSGVIDFAKTNMPYAIKPYATSTADRLIEAEENPMRNIEYWLYRSALWFIAIHHFRYDPDCKLFIKRGPRGTKGRGIQCKRCRIERSIEDVIVKKVG